MFTPETVRRLLPFTFTLLQGAGVRLRLVANGCGPEEIDLLRDAAATDERLSHHVLPAPDLLTHGAALNHLFEAFADEPYFAFADSDVIAGGDFMPCLSTMAAKQAGVFAAAPVWAADADLVVPPEWPVLSGRMNVLADGTHVGGTYLAIYDRAAVEPVWRRAPQGFEPHFRPFVARAMRAELAARGWDYRIFDTARLVNLLLLLEGRTLENRVVPQLHHVGGLSSTTPFTGPVAVLRNLPLLLRSRIHRRLKPVAEYVGFRLLLWRRLREPRHHLINERRSAISAYVHAVLGAIEAGEPVPPPLRTDSADVDERLAALIETIEERYRPLRPG